HIRVAGSEHAHVALQLVRGYLRHNATVLLVHRLLTAAQLIRKPGLETEDRTERPSARDGVESPIVEREHATLAEWQAVGAERLNHVPDVEWRGAAIHRAISQRREVAEIVDVLVVAVSERVRPGVMEIESESVRETLAQFQLQCVVVGEGIIAQEV